MQGEREPEIREMLVVDDPDTMRMILSGKYNDILELISSREMSVSDISKALGINPGSAHYRLKELEKKGLVKKAREETKGNVVKKYYRASARNIYLDGSRFKVPGPGEDSPMDEFYERLFRLLEPFGYAIPSDKAVHLKDAIMRYDKRKKELLQQIQDTGIEKMEGDRLLVSDAYRVAWLLKEIEDDGLRGIREEIRLILAKIRGP